MREVLYEPSAGSLIAFLNANTQALPVDLYTFELQNGTTLRYTSCEIPLTVDGVTYLRGPTLTRSRTKFNVGISVDTMDLQIDADGSVLVGGMGIISAVALGMFDGANVSVAHAFYDSELQIKGTILSFAGRVGQVVTQRGHASIQVRSHSELLDIMIPGDLFQPGCKNTLFDNYCKISRQAAGTGGVVSGGLVATNNKFATSNVPTTSWTPPGGLAVRWADMGVVTFTSGPNAGVSRTIKRQTVSGGTSTLEFVSPFPATIGVGDAFDCFPGCDKTIYTCTNKYANKANFRGEPFVPAPESII